MIDFKNARSGKLRKDKLGNVRRQHFWRVRCYFHATPNVSFILELFKCSLNRSTFLFLSRWLTYLDRQLSFGLSSSGNYLVKVAMSCFLNVSRWRPIWHSLYFFCNQGHKVFPLLISNRRDIQFPVTTPEKKTRCLPRYCFFGIGSYVAENTGSIWRPVTLNTQAFIYNVYYFVPF